MIPLSKTGPNEFHRYDYSGMFKPVDMTVEEARALLEKEKVKAVEEAKKRREQLGLPPLAKEEIDEFLSLGRE